jgi:hypothetical protein
MRCCDKLNHLLSHKQNHQTKCYMWVNKYNALIFNSQPLRSTRMTYAIFCVCVCVHLHMCLHTHTQTHMHTFSLICTVIVYFFKCITSPYTLYIILPYWYQSNTQVTSLSSLCYYLSWMQYMFDILYVFRILHFYFSPCLTHILTLFTF